LVSTEAVNHSAGSQTNRLVQWAQTNLSAIAFYAVFGIAYFALSLARTPRVIDNFPDSHTYLTLSFLGHAERLWTVPLLYYVGGTDAGRVLLQTVIGALCWIALAVQIGRVLQSRVIRICAQVWILLMALCAPILQWNRLILSESVSISLTVLFLAASLALARRRDQMSLGTFLIVALVWTFTRQVQSFIVAALVVPFVILAWHKPAARKLATIGAVGIVVLGVWGTLTTLQNSSVSPRGIAATNQSEVQLAGIVQFRAVTDPKEIGFLYAHGMPHTSTLKVPPPFTTLGQPVNVTQFANPYAEYELADDSKFKRWADRQGQAVYLRYLITHPWTAASQPLLNSPQLMTMNPDYAAASALPSWASTLLYGNLSSVVSSNSPSGAPRSSDPIYLVVLLCIGVVLFGLTAVRDKLTYVVWVGVAALLFAALWAVAVWDFAATELPRELVETAVLAHLALIVMIAGALDALISRTTRRSGSPVGARHTAMSSSPRT
jgi:hypothetical protein